MRPIATVYRHPVAARIAAWSVESGTSLRELSRAAGLSPSAAQKVCSQLETGNGNVGLATLSALAAAMSKPLGWLLYGDAPPVGICLRSLPEWDEAARDAVARFGADPATVEAIGKWLVHQPPARLDAWLVAGMARSFSGT